VLSASVCCKETKMTQQCTVLTDAIPDATDEFFLSLPSSGRRPLPAGGSTVLMTWPLLSTSTCLLPPPTAARFGELLLNGRGLFAERMPADADGDNSWWSDGPVVDGNVARFKDDWKPVTALTGGLNRLVSNEAVADVRKGWEPSAAAMLYVAGGRTAWPTVSNTRGAICNVWTGGWLDTTAGCETTTIGDSARLVETLPKQCGDADREVDNKFSDDEIGHSDTDGSVVFLLAISSSNYNTAWKSKLQFNTALQYKYGYIRDERSGVEKRPAMF